LSRKERRYKGLAEVFTSGVFCTFFYFEKLQTLRSKVLIKDRKTSCCNFINSNYNINTEEKKYDFSKLYRKGGKES